MARLTITLSTERHRALKRRALLTGKSIRELIDESLELAGIKSETGTQALVAAARRRAAMDEADALSLAVGETRAVRNR